MAAPKLRSDADVKCAIERWRGNVRAAADELGIKPDNLRARLKVLAVDLEGLRKRGAPFRDHKRGTPQGPVMRPMGSGAANAGGGRESLGAPFPAGGARSKLVVMSSAVPELARRGEKPIRVLPDHADRIRRGRRRLSAEADSDVDDSALLAQFIEEQFESWLEDLIRRVREDRRIDAQGAAGGP
jgi:hypothetical protein